SIPGAPLAGRLVSRIAIATPCPLQGAAARHPRASGKNPWLTAGSPVLLRGTTDRPPGPTSIAREQLVGRLRTIAPRLVGRDLRLLRRPGIEHRLHDAPRLLDHVGPHE